jgi:hypothetical protein
MVATRRPSDGEESTVRKRARTLLVALSLAILATVLVAGPAQAVEVKQQTHDINFASGHTGKIKIALEKDNSNNTARGHVGVWCTSTQGATVKCGAVEFDGSIHTQYWNEGVGWTTSRQDPLDYLDTDPPLTINHYNLWHCPGVGQDQYRALIVRVRVQDAFGQWSSWRTLTHPTWNGSFC